MATTARPNAPGRITQTSEVRQAPRPDQAEEHPGRGREVLRPARAPGSTSRSPRPRWTRAMFKEGLGFDGSSIRGFQAINESDMLLLPDVSTAFVDPVLEVPTLSLTCDIYDPITLEPYSRDPAVHRVQGGGVPQDHAASRPRRTGDPRRSSSSSTRCGSTRTRTRRYYHIDSEEGIWNSGRNGTPEPGPPAPAQGGLFPGPAGRPAAGRAVEDHARADRCGHPGRGAAPRGRPPRARPRSTSGSAPWSRRPTG